MLVSQNARFHSDSESERDDEKPQSTSENHHEQSAEAKSPLESAQFAAVWASEQLHGRTPRSTILNGGKLVSLEAHFGFGGL